MPQLTLNTSLSKVIGIGDKTAAVLAKKNIHTVRDVLLFAPVRYEDRSQRKSIDQLIPGELITLQAQVLSSAQHYRGRRSIQRVVVTDGTGRLTLMWFNASYMIKKMVKNAEFLISGILNDKRVMVHPNVENVSANTLHTDRLVPVYSLLPGIKLGMLRRILKQVLENLRNVEHVHNIESLPNTGVEQHDEQKALYNALYQLHFPDSTDHVIAARERIALEELIALIIHSQHIKETWKNQTKTVAIPPLSSLPILPFQMTAAQERVIGDIAHDLHQITPMNRLLLGDVGSGKTVVAAIAAKAVLTAGYSACLIAPTKILAQQHTQTIQSIFPDIPIKLFTGASRVVSASKVTGTSNVAQKKQPLFYIGTHTILNQLSTIKPALLIYDEQHRFGVTQRSAATNLNPSPHILTLTATPIPRTLMLTIFSHLSLSVIDELPRGRQPVKTWVVPESKRAASYEWVKEQLRQLPTQQPQINLSSRLCIIVCPFIDPSEAEGLAHVSSVTTLHKSLSQAPVFQNLSLSTLHSRMKPVEQARVIKALYDQEIDILITTPIVEVGVDLPAADIMIIENAERFGLASLHQLRGRVGRANQQAYCLLFSPVKNDQARTRLNHFATIHDGQKLAELDLERRGAGDIFGTLQHGFETLQFANWTNLSLITQAKQHAEKLQKRDQTYESPLFSFQQMRQKTAHSSVAPNIPLAN